MLTRWALGHPTRTPWKLQGVQALDPGHIPSSSGKVSLRTTDGTGVVGGGACGSPCLRLPSFVHEAKGSKRMPQIMLRVTVCGHCTHGGESSLPSSGTFLGDALLHFPQFLTRATRLTVSALRLS